MTKKCHTDYLGGTVKKLYQPIRQDKPETEMNYGKREDWNTVDYTQKDGIYCNSCGNSLFKCYYRDDNSVICLECFDSHFGKDEKPVEKQPITEWSDDLIGRTVANILDGYRYIICKKENDNLMWIKGLYEKDIACVKIEDLFGRYALVEFTFELEKEKQSIAVSANPVSIETTHSAVLEFPNGEIIKIPEPGEGWIEKIIWDEWHGKDYKESEINAWKERVLEINRDYDKCETYIVDDDEVQYQIVHHCGFVIVNEYENRINEEHPNINRLTRWTREVKPKVETIERYTQSEFPMLEGPQPTSGFEIEDHKVVFRKQDTSTKYPGANKRAPDPKWSGVWLEGHAPPIKQKD